jgi:dihydrolipoamide dehydrogenase
MHAQVSYVKGYGKLAPNGKVEVMQNDGSTVTLSTKNTIIATGSTVTSLPGLEIDEER